MGGTWCEPPLPTRNRPIRLPIPLHYITPPISPIPTHDAGKAMVTPRRLGLSMDGGDHLLSDGPHVRLPIDNPIEYQISIPSINVVVIVRLNLNDLLRRPKLQISTINHL
ncbi:hypothetical protein EVAR_6890_1 [Eumeta japonica]|uniref:Uncharacterized protein n=1 Tax=Eumeta variegata TaxID=151549 RepID=A0A4C1TGA3_EUMVA|nr:hypothetical protein EVAR_6890_1 [Eumeta japonica]